MAPRCRASDRRCGVPGHRFGRRCNAQARQLSLRLDVLGPCIGFAAAPGRPLKSQEKLVTSGRLADTDGYQNNGNWIGAESIRPAMRYGSAVTCRSNPRSPSSADTSSACSTRGPGGRNAPFLKSARSATRGAERQRTASLLRRAGFPDDLGPLGDLAADQRAEGLGATEGGLDAEGRQLCAQCRRCHRPAQAWGVLTAAPSAMTSPRWPQAARPNAATMAPASAGPDDRSREPVWRTSFIGTGFRG